MVELKYRIKDEKTGEDKWIVEGTFANAAIARIVAFRSDVPLSDVKIETVAE